MRSFVVGERLTNGTDGFRNYLNELGKIKLLSNDEYISVLRDLNSSDDKLVEKAKEMLVRNSLRFVVSVAKQYLVKGIDISDLVSEGNIGLLKAAEKYDPASEYRFLSYAVWWVRKYILNYINSQRLIKIPQNKLDILNKLRKFAKNYNMVNLVDPSVDDFISAGFTIEEYEFYESSHNLDATSLDDEIAMDEGSLTKKDLLVSNYDDLVEDQTNEESNKYKVQQLLTRLSQKEREIIIDLFGMNGGKMHVVDVAKKHNLCTERIRQIKDSSLKKLRGYESFITK